MGESMPANDPTNDETPPTPMVPVASDTAKDQTTRQEKAVKQAALGRRCFVVMPFGEKYSLAELISNAKRTEQNLRDSYLEDDHIVSAPINNIDFDAVYKYLIKPVTEDAGFAVTRSDEIVDSGMIHQQMLEQVIDSDLAVVDISAHNPNVFYELGVRHTARRSGTVLLSRKGEAPPFNIAGMRVVEYPALRTTEQWRDQAHKGEIDAAKDQLSRAIVAALSPSGGDSPVHTLIPGLNVSRKSKPLPYRISVTCGLDRFIESNLNSENSEFVGAAPNPPVTDLKTRAAGRRLGIVQGDLIWVTCADAWVNPESTRFEMARIHDNSVSAIIRTRSDGTERLSHIDEDSLATSLRKEALKAGGQVEPGSALALPAPDRLWASNRVHTLVHLAAQTGTRGRGYETIRNVDDCVFNVLSAVDRYNRRAATLFSRQRRVHTLLFPLFGTQNPDRDPNQVAETLVRTAAQYMSVYEETQIQTVYFLAYTDRDLDLLRQTFYRLNLAKPSVMSAPSAEQPSDQDPSDQT